MTRSDVSEANAALGYIDRLVEATQDGDMQWIRATPTTFVWETSTPVSARIILQKISRPHREGSTFRMQTVYLLRAWDDASRSQKVMIDGGYDEPVNSRLASLYDLIPVRLTYPGLDFLESIMPPKRRATE